MHGNAYTRAEQCFPNMEGDSSNTFEIHPQKLSSFRCSLDRLDFPVGFECLEVAGVPNSSHIAAIDHALLILIASRCHTMAKEV